MPDLTGQAENQTIPTTPAVAPPATPTDSPPAKPLPAGVFSDTEEMPESDAPDWMSQATPNTPPVAPAQETPPETGTPPTETPPSEETEQPGTPPAPEQQTETEETTPAEEKPDGIQALISHLKGETPPETAAEPEAPDTELPWHKRLGDDELESAKGQIAVNDDGTVQVPQITVNKAGEREIHIKTYATVQEALESLMKAPLTARRAIFDAQHAQEQLEQLREGATQPVTPPESPGLVEGGATPPILPDLQPFGGQQNGQQQGTQTEPTSIQPPTTQTPIVSVGQQLYDRAYQETLKQWEPRAEEQFRKEREAEIRLERSLEPDEPVTLTTRDKRNIRRDAKAWIKEEAQDSELFQQNVQGKVAQYQNNYNQYWTHEEAQAHAMLGPQAGELLAPMLEYRKRVEIAGQSPQSEDEVVLHRIMTDMNGEPNIAVLGTLAFNHMALRRSLPEIKAAARKEGEMAVLEKIEAFQQAQAAVRTPTAPKAEQVVAESHTGAQTAPPGFSETTVPQDSFLSNLGPESPPDDKPTWMTPI
jgi:hypothetical protein